MMLSASVGVLAARPSRVWSPAFGSGSGTKPTGTEQN
jgi:hypothetical protein